MTLIICDKSYFVSQVFEKNDRFPPSPLPLHSKCLRKTDRHWDCFHFWLLWTELLWAQMCKCPHRTLLSILLGLCPDELLGHIVVLFFTFWGTFILFSIVVAPFYLPPTVHRGYNFSTCLPIVVFWFLRFLLAIILMSVMWYLIVVLCHSFINILEEGTE